MAQLRGLEIGVLQCYKAKKLDSARWDSKGSWVVISGAIIRVTMVATPIRDL